MTLRRNTAVNLAGQAFGLLVSLATVPPFLRIIGEARYGVLLVVWSLLGYFGFFDLGVSQATTQQIASLRGASPLERKRVLGTAVAMNSSLGILAAIALLVVGKLVLGHFVSVSPTLRDEALRAMPWIALSLPVSMLAGVFAGALQGREAFLSSTVATSIGQLLAQLLPLGVARWFSVELEWLVPAALCARLLTALLLYWFCRRAVPFKGRWIVDTSLALRLLRFGGWVTVSSVVGPLMSSLDRVVVGSIAGSQAVTYYGVPQGFAARLLMLPSSLAGTLLPRLAGTPDNERASLAAMSVKAVACVMTPLLLGGLALAGPFFGVWISPQFSAKVTTGAQVLLVGVWFNGQAMVAHSSLMARGRPDVIARVHLFELPVYLGFLAMALWLWGVVGAAIAWTARAAGDAILLFAMAGYLRWASLTLAIPVGLLGGSLMTLHLLPDVYAWILEVFLVGLSLMWSYRSLPPALLPRRFRSWVAGDS